MTARAARPLPPDFEACVAASAAGRPTRACDAAVGARIQGHGYCAQAPWADTAYCACANAEMKRPECIYAPCADQPLAYKTVAAQAAMRPGSAHPCAREINCATTQIVGTNRAAGVRAVPCDPLRLWALAHLTQIVFVVILVAVLAVLVAAERHRAAERRRAPHLRGPNRRR